MDAPWMNNKEWARGRISSHSGAAVIVVWVFAGLSNALIWTATYLFHAEQGEHDVMKVMALFCAIGVGLLAWAAKRTWQWIRHGSSILELSSVPGVIGGTLEGALHTRLREFPDNPIQLTLTCNRRYLVRAPQRSKESDRVENEVLWQADRSIGRSAITYGPRGLSCPVRIPLPYGLPQSDESRKEEQFVWTLTASCDVPGVDFDVSFNVPAFVTAQSRQDWTEEVVDAMVDEEERAESPGPEPPTQFGGRWEVRQTTPGGTRYDFRLFVTPKVAVLIPLTGLAITGGSAALYWWLGEMGPFAVIPGVIGALFLLASGILLTYRSRVVVEDGVLTVRRAAFGIPITWRIPLPDVRGVKVRHEVIEGARADARDWDLVIARRGGAEVKVGASFRQRSEAEAVAKELQELAREGASEPPAPLA